MRKSELESAGTEHSASIESADVRWDYFVSYTKSDLTWAEWIAWNIESSGKTVLLQAWDMVPGSHWTTAMQEAMAKSVRTIAVVSKNYLSSAYGRTEWQAAFNQDPAGFNRKLVPIRIDQCELPGVLGQVVHIDMCDLSEQLARGMLLAQLRAIEIGRAKPERPPIFPGPTSIPPELTEIAGHTNFLTSMSLTSVDSVQAVGMSSDGRQLITGYSGGRFISWREIPRREGVGWIQKSQVRVQSLDYVSDIVAVPGTQKYIVSSEEADVSLIDFEGPSAPRVRRNILPAKRSNNITISADGALLSTSGNERGVWNIENLADPGCKFISKGLDGRPRKGDFANSAVSSSGHLFCYADGDGTPALNRLDLGPLNSASCKRAARGENNMVYVTFAADSDKYLFLASYEELEVWEVAREAPKLLNVIESRVGEIYHISTSPHLPLLAIAGEAGFQILDFRDPDSIIVRFTHESNGVVRFATFSPNRNLLFTPEVGNVRTWRFAT